MNSTHDAEREEAKVLAKKNEANFKKTRFSKNMAGMLQTISLKKRT